MPIRSRAVRRVGPATASDGAGMASIPGPDDGNSPLCISINHHSPKAEDRTIVTSVQQSRVSRFVRVS